MRRRAYQCSPNIVIYIEGEGGSEVFQVPESIHRSFLNPKTYYTEARNFSKSWSIFMRKSSPTAYMYIIDVPMSVDYVIKRGEG